MVQGRVFVLLLAGVGCSAITRGLAMRLPAEAPAAEQFPFDGPGPFLASIALDDVSLPMSADHTGCEGPLCTVRLAVFVPEDAAAVGAGCRPLVIFSPGFMVGYDRYRSYGRRLATWGFNALLWEPTHELLPFRVNSHQTLSKFVDAILAWSAEENVTASSPLYNRLNLSAGVSLGL